MLIEEVGDKCAHRGGRRYSVLIEEVGDKCAHRGGRR